MICADIPLCSAMLTLSAYSAERPARTIEVRKQKDGETGTMLGYSLIPMSWERTRKAASWSRPAPSTGSTAKQPNG